MLIINTKKGKAKEAIAANPMIWIVFSSSIIIQEYIIEDMAHITPMQNLTYYIVYMQNLTYYIIWLQKK